MSGGELKSFDRVADVYDATRAMPAEVSTAVADAIAALAREVSAEPRLVEVGIGTGRIAVPLTERGVHVTGIDISAAMLGVLLGKRRDINVMLAESAQPPFPPATFDASLFVHILHLVPDPEATVRATLALVRPGGIAMAGGDDPSSSDRYSSIHRNSIRDNADGIIQRTVLELSGVEMGGWQPYATGHQTFQRVARELGAAVEERRLAGWSSSTTARRMLERLEARDFSSAWKIPEAIMPELLARVRPPMEQLFGGIETPVAFERSFSLTVARLQN
jgi:ubiquinone/menaquinone biosynthesis C-methylase UbiE